MTGVPDEPQDDIMATSNEGQHDNTAPKIPLSVTAPPLTWGAAAFSNQLHPDPKSLPSREIVFHALNKGFRAFDTSP